MILFENATLWDGLADHARPGMSVLVEGERIREVSERPIAAAGADWQLHAYGGTMHAFTNPEANDPGFGTVYSARADARSWQAMHNFLAEVLA